MPVIQVPPGVGTSGQLLDAAGSSGALRQIVSVGDFGTSALAPVTTSAGQLVSVSSGTFTLSSAPTVNVSSGTFTLSSNPTVVSASSGLVQISNPTTAVTISNTSFTVNLSTVFSLSSAPLVIVASSGGTIPVSLSTVFSLSSAPLVVVATSGGTIPVSLSTVVSLSSQITATVNLQTSMVVNTLTSGAMVLSSAGITQVFTSSNTPIVVATSVGFGSVTQTVLSASSGVVQALLSTGSVGGVTSTFFVLTSVKGVKASAGRLMGVTVYTTIVSGTPVVAFYDFTSGNVSVGTSMNLVLPIPLMTTAAAQQMQLPGPDWFGPQGIQFSNGISVAPQVSATGAVLSTTTFTVPPSISVQYV